MKNFTSPILLSLCTLTLLSGCAKDDHRDGVIVDPIVNPDDDINLPGGRGSDHRLNVRMIRAGLRESSEIRRQRGLAPLQFDQDLTRIAQHRAREIRLGSRRWQDDQDSRRMPAGPDGRPGSGRDHRDDRGGRNGRDHGDGRHDHDGRDGRDWRDDRRNDRRWSGEPNFGYAAENSIIGIRSAEQAFRYFMSNGSTNVNLVSPLYQRHGIGYYDGVWVEIFAY